MYSAMATMVDADRSQNQMSSSAAARMSQKVVTGTTTSLISSPSS